LLLFSGAHKANSPSITNRTFVSFDDTPATFDNNIFHRVLDGTCVVPVDCEFAKVPSLLKLIKLYSSDYKAFFADYAVSMQKMTELNSKAVFGKVANIYMDTHIYGDV
jgi:hypothetical protein